MPCYRLPHSGTVAISAPPLTFRGPAPPPPPVRGTSRKIRKMPSSQSSAASSVTATTPGSAMSGRAALLMGDLRELGIAELVEIPRREPHKVAPCVQLASEASLTQATTPSKEEPPFDTSVTKLDKIPKGFMREHLISLAPAVLDDKMMKKMKLYDGVTRAMFFFAHSLLEKTNMPKLCFNKQVWRDTFRRCHTAMGDSIRSLALRTVEVNTKDGTEDIQEVEVVEWGMLTLSPKGVFPTCMWSMRLA